jgi:FtsP/CotA-like multicopper oxidase with cupredoxin domain
MISRRQSLKAAMLGGAGALLAAAPAVTNRAAAQAVTPFTVTPFLAKLPIPPVLEPFDLNKDPKPYPARRPTPGQVYHGAGGAPGQVFHGIAPEFDRAHPDHDPDWDRNPLKSYKMFIEQRIAQIIPGVNTPVFTYRDANKPAGQGTAPGPTILARFNEPIAVRLHNDLVAAKTYVHHDIETSAHHHSGHNPAHADGHPAFYTLPGKARDYYYPNIVPKRVINGVRQFDRTDIPSTTWYHDHAMDITGFNVSRGLAGYYLMLDELEERLMTTNVLPKSQHLTPNNAPQFDIPLALTDQSFNADGTLVYDFLDHDGRLGDVFTVNGAVQPYFKVQRRKYRFRVLNASNARYYQLRLSGGQKFLRIGKDGWLFPYAVAAKEALLCSGERADIIVDFRDAPSVVYLENIMRQTNGRKPDGPDPNRPTPLVKFIVEGAAVVNDATVAAGTPLRPHDPIKAADITVTRVFEFNRGNGAWQVNGRFFNPRRADAVPARDEDGVAAERWIFKNGGGGWWHPIHTHLEHHEVQKINGKAPSIEQRFKSDLVNLEGNDVAEVFIHLRTFTGPFVFHCHIVEHEDMRMMGTHDPRPTGERSRLDGVTEIDPMVSGVPPTCEELEPTLFFDAAGDVDRLEGRGVGIPCDDFKPGGPL